VKAGDILRAVGAALIGASLALHWMMVLRYGNNPMPPAPRWPFAGIATEAVMLVGGATLFLATKGRQ